MSQVPAKSVLGNFSLNDTLPHLPQKPSGFFLEEGASS